MRNKWKILQIYDNLTPAWWLADYFLTTNFSWLFQVEVQQFDFLSGACQAALLAKDKAKLIGAHQRGDQMVHI